MNATFVLGAPLNNRLAPGRNPVPLIVTKASVPLWPLAGLREVMTGAGGCVAVMLNGADMPAGGGSTTLIEKVPIEGKEKPDTDSWVELTTVAFQYVPPFALTAAPGRNPVPVTVMFVGVAASKEVGLTEVMVGTTVGCVMTKDIGADGPPPGAGFVTVTWTVPAVAISAVEIVANAF